MTISVPEFTITRTLNVRRELVWRTRTEGYYERLGASRSLGFRLTRENLGLGTQAEYKDTIEGGVESHGG